MTETKAGVKRTTEELMVHNLASIPIGERPIIQLVEESQFDAICGVMSVAAAEERKELLTTSVGYSHSVIVALLKLAKAGIKTGRSIRVIFSGQRTLHQFWESLCGYAIGEFTATRETFEKGSLDEVTLTHIKYKTRLTFVLETATYGDESSPTIGGWPEDSDVFIVPRATDMGEWIQECLTPFFAMSKWKSRVLLIRSHP